MYYLLWLMKHVHAYILQYLTSMVFKFQLQVFPKPARVVVNGRLGIPKGLQQWVGLGKGGGGREVSRH